VFKVVLSALSALASALMAVCRLCNEENSCFGSGYDLWFVRDGNRRGRKGCSGRRCSGGPQPPPPDERTSKQSPGSTSIPTSLVRNTRGGRLAEISL